MRIESGTRQQVPDFFIFTAYKTDKKKPRRRERLELHLVIGTGFQYIIFSFGSQHPFMKSIKTSINES